MTIPLGLNFADFKSLSGNHRIYFYEGETFFDFLFLVDSQMVITTLPKSEIDNYERFFSDKMFYGAKRLTFRIPMPDDNSFTIVQKTDNVDIVDMVQDEEVKNINIQAEGVDTN